MTRILLTLALCWPILGLAAPADDVAKGPACAALSSFYWEVGDVNGPLASGSVRPTRAGISRTTMLSIASASKWPYGAYVDQLRGGFPTTTDLRYLNLKSGWTRFTDKCDPTDTVASCAARVGYVKRTDGKFDYGGGHMQVHARDNGLGALNAAKLGDWVNASLGTTFTYTSPQPAGGIRTSTAAYVAMLQRMMSGKLTAGAYLFANGVPTQGPQAIKSPVPEAWLYGRGHWIELDGTASSPGAFGFYPYITADKQLYGVVAAQVSGGAWAAVQCGQAIRHAYRAAK